MVSTSLVTQMIEMFYMWPFCITTLFFTCSLSGGFPLIPLPFSHPTAKRSMNMTQANQANEQLIVHFSKPRLPAPKPQGPPPPPTTAPVPAGTRTPPKPAPRAQTANLKRPPLKKPGAKAPNCPPPLPPPLQGKAVPSVAQWEKWRVILLVVTFHLSGVMCRCTTGPHDITIGCVYRCNTHRCCVTILKPEKD